MTQRTSKTSKQSKQHTAKMQQNESKIQQQQIRETYKNSNEVADLSFANNYINNNNQIATDKSATENILKLQQAYLSVVFWIANLYCVWSSASNYKIHVQKLGSRTWQEVLHEIKCSTKYVGFLVPNH